MNGNIDLFALMMDEEKSAEDCTLQTSTERLANIYADVLNKIEDLDKRIELANSSFLDCVNSDRILVLFCDNDDYDYFVSDFSAIQKAFREYFDLPVELSFDSVERLEGREDQLENQNYQHQEEEEEEGLRLSPDQRKALLEIKMFLYDEENLLYRIKGYAGTGKTHLVCEFIKSIRSLNIDYLAACPTNKAAKNLRNIAANAKLDLEIKTVAQLLGQQPEVNQETGKEEFINNETDYFGQHDVIIIDEFSMVCREDFKEIMNQSAIHNTKIIFVGDEAQLPPVKEKEPMVIVHPMPESKLTKVIRYDGDIARLAEAIRVKSVLPSFTTSADETVICLPRKEWLAKAIEKFDSESFAENPDYVRFLAWRNKTVRSLNNAIRLHLWGEDAKAYVPGDRLIALKPLFQLSPGGKGKNKWKIYCNNSEEVVVVGDGILSELKYNKEIYQYWTILARSDVDGKQFQLKVLHESSEKLHKRKVKEHAKAKQWSSYFDLTKMFDNIGYAYALTVHKAQGSTINNVFLDASDMKHSCDRRKLLYTALTRTQDQAFILR